jgi:FMN phosphatase YigB (HAD superfamily)
MLNALYKDINWDDIETVGFDMDGTLYDEFEFIKQVFIQININLIRNDKVLNFMLSRWLEKGSSYPFIFDEVYNLYDIEDYTKEEFIQKSLDIFREINPNLELSERNKFLLEYFKNNFSLFLVTDGNPILQRKKYNALNLSKYFDDDKILFTGDYACDYYKPNIKVLEKISFNNKKTIYFGDRNKDREFANLANIKFQKVYNMIRIEK